MTKIFYKILKTDNEITLEEVKSLLENNKKRRSKKNKVVKLSNTINDLRVNQRIVVYCVDNSDGEDDLVYKIAYKDEKGELMDDETNYPILEYVGDKIIEWWLLTPGSGLTWQENDDV